MKELITEARPSPIAGSWYIGEKSQLSNYIDKVLQEVESDQVFGNIIGLIVPHAGHTYSGVTAAKAYKAIVDLKPEVVVIFSPHHAFTPHLCSTTAYGYYQTPLGKVPVDHVLLNAVSKELVSRGHSQIFLSPTEKEHAIEIQLPFIQKIFSHEFSLAPIMLRNLNNSLIGDLVSVLSTELIEKKVLVISSTDLSHFYPEIIAKRLDGLLIKALEKYSVDGLLEATEKKGSEACGLSGLISTILLTKSLGGKSCKILGYSTSAEVTGDFSSVVGYVSAIIST